MIARLNNSIFSFMLRLAILLLGCQVALGGDSQSPANAHTASHPPKATISQAASAPTNAGGIVPSPREINPAFRDTSDQLASTNIIEKIPVTPGSSKQADLDAMLEWARRMKREKNYEAAEKSFIMVLKAGAPDEMNRTAMLEMALMAQENQQPGRAQQIYAQYLERYSDDPSAAEVCLRQGLLYRQ